MGGGGGVGGSGGVSVRGRNEITRGPLPDRQKSFVLWWLKRCKYPT